MTRKLGFVLLLLLICLMPATVSAETSDIRLLESSTDADFPNVLSFNVRAESSVPITRIRLRYEVAKKVYAPTFAEAWSEFQPAKDVSATWSWDMRKGILPPGARVTYWWVIEDSAGNRLTTPKQKVTFDDTRYKWQQVSDQNINIYWYQGSRTFAGDLLKAAVEAKERLERDTGADLDEPVYIYIYANYSELRSSIVDPDEWTGGVAYNGYNIISIGISPNNLAWGKKAVAHELGHLVTQQLIGGPYGAMRPLWLDEGLAMHAEGDQSEATERELQLAIDDGRIATLRSLSSPFPASAEGAFYAYAQSQSVVEYLINNYGKEKINQFLVLLNDGYSVDEALIKVYGFDLGGLDDAWLTYMISEPQAKANTDKITRRNTHQLRQVLDDLNFSPAVCIDATGGG